MTSAPIGVDPHQILTIEIYTDQKLVPTVRFFGRPTHRDVVFRSVVQHHWRSGGQPTQEMTQEMNLAVNVKVIEKVIIVSIVL